MVISILLLLYSTLPYIYLNTKLFKGVDLAECEHMSRELYPEQVRILWDQPTNSTSLSDFGEPEYRNAALIICKAE